MGCASNIPNDSWHLFFKTAFPSAFATRSWSREMFHEYVFGHLHATDERDVTIIDVVKQMSEQINIPDGVRIKNLQKALVAEGFNHNVIKLAMIKVEMAVVTDVPKPLQEATHTLEGDGLLALIITDIINRTAL